MFTFLFLGIYKVALQIFFPKFSRTNLLYSFFAPIWKSTYFIPLNASLLDSILELSIVFHNILCSGSTNTHYFVYCGFNSLLWNFVGKISFLFYTYCKYFNFNFHRELSNQLNLKKCLVRIYRLHIYAYYFSNVYSIKVSIHL